MRWSLKLALLAACLGLATVAPAPGKEDKAKDADKKAQAEKKKSAGKKKDSKDPSKQPDDGKGRISLPLVEGHDSFGLKIPYYDSAGKLQMNFVIGVATRLDPDHVGMKETQVETFNEEGETEMTVNLPESVLDLNTRVVTSQTRTTISRDDFTIVGDSVAFNTLTKQGKLIGNVHMTIYDLGDEAAPPESKSNEPKEPNVK